MIRFLLEMSCFESDAASPNWPMTAWGLVRTLGGHEKFNFPFHDKQFPIRVKFSCVRVFTMGAQLLDQRQRHRPFAKA